MPGRKYSPSSGSGPYRYGFNGKENDNDVKGEGNQQDYGMRIYDTRLGRFLSVDPLTKNYPHYTPYSYAGNKPIKFIDLDGGEEKKHWYDYDFNDLMNWLGRSDNTLGNINRGQGPIGEKVASFNRNVNLIGIVGYNGYQIVTGKDLDTKQAAPGGRMSGVTNLGVNLLMYATGEKLPGAFFSSQAQREMASVSLSPKMQQSQTLLRQETSSTVVKAIEEDGYAVVKDAQGVVAGKGWLTQGELNLTIKTKGTQLEGQGADVFRRIYETVNTEFGAVNTIRGTWRQGALGDNLSTLNNLLKEGKSLEEAAIGTFTGKLSSRLGYSKVTVTGTKDVNGIYTSVDAIFSKPKK